MNVFDTVEALEDRRAVVKESMHGDQMVLFTKAQETEDKMLTSSFYIIVITVII